MSIDTKAFLVQAERILEQVKPLAADYLRITGKPLGITGEIAEYEAVRLLGLEVCVARQAGYDAYILQDGQIVKKIQIKGRVYKKNQRVPRIEKSKEWDSVMLVILDDNYNAMEIHEAERNDIIIALEKPGSKARNERNSLNVRSFKAISRVVWEK